MTTANTSSSPPGTSIPPMRACANGLRTNATCAASGDRCRRGSASGRAGCARPRGGGPAPDQPPAQARCPTAITSFRPGEASCRSQAALTSSERHELAVHARGARPRRARSACGRRPPSARGRSIPDEIAWIAPWWLRTSPAGADVGARRLTDVHEAPLGGDRRKSRHRGLAPQRSRSRCRAVRRPPLERLGEVTVAKLPRPRRRRARARARAARRCVPRPRRGRRPSLRELHRHLPDRAGRAEHEHALTARPARPARGRAAR